MYYDLNKRGFVSNSDLTELKQQMYAIERPENLQKIFNMGNLAETAFIEPDKINRETGTVEGIDGVVFEMPEIEKAEAMREAFWDDPMYKTIFPQMRYQHVYTRNHFPISHNGFDFTLPTRIKMDGEVKGVLGADIKTTAAVSHAQFVAALHHFDVDRQVAWYMDIARLDRFVLAGVSKKKHKRNGHGTFKYAVQRGDEFYNSGKSKYQYLAFHYYFLIHQFVKNETQNIN